MALSGGGDSVALLRLTCAWAWAASRPVLALTVDHLLNPQSGDWTRFAGEAAARAGAAFRALSWEDAKPAHGLPAAARRARHALLAVAAREAGAAVILLGHTADDVDETERMRAGDARGIGRLREWAPSPAWPEGRGVFLLRPLLRVRREALRECLRAEGEPWLDDTANEDTRYARVRARQASSPPPAPTPPDDDAVARLGALAAGLPDGALALPLSALRAADPAVARRVLSAAVLCVGGGVVPPRSAAVDRLFDPALTPATLAGVLVERQGDQLQLRREQGDRRQAPRPVEDGVVDGRRLEADGGDLTYTRFRAATFQIVDEAALRTTSSP